MCLVETHTYISEDGIKRHYEKTQLCQYASGDRLCDDTTYKQSQVRLIETKPDAARISRDAEDVVIVHDKHGRERTYHPLSRREGRKTVRHSEEILGSASLPSSPSSPGRPSTKEIRPQAPSPPLPSLGRHFHPLNSTRPTHSDCPMMSGARNVRDNSPPSRTSDDFIRTRPEVGHRESREPKSVTIKVPRSFERTTPTLKTPPPPKRVQKPGYKRHDSGKEFSNPYDTADNEFYKREAARERAREERIELDAQARQNAITREQIERERVARSEREQEDALQELQREEAYRRSYQLRADNEARGQQQQPQSHDRKKQAQAAADAAYRSGRQQQREAEKVTAYNRRIQGEERARAQERRDIEIRRSQDMDMLSRLAPISRSPASPRNRPERGILIHYERSMPHAAVVESRLSIASGEDIILREQQRMAKQERDGLHRASLDDPLEDDPWRTGGQRNVVREYTLSEQDTRRERMRKYREDARRRLE